MRMMGFCLGLGAGLGLGMLFAPRAGNKTRSLVRTKAMDGIAYVKRRTDDVREGTAELFQEATDRVALEGEAVKAAVMAGKRAYEKVATS
jgi:gas vesicle protein